MLNRWRVGLSVFAVFGEWAWHGGSFVKTASVVPDGFEVAVELLSLVYGMIGSI